MLIRLGKAIKALQEEGLISGGKRIILSFFSLFRRVGSGDILFITNGVGDSARFRVHHHAEELAFHGFRCSISVQDNPFLPRYVNKFKVFIFHRVFYTPRVAKLIEKIKSLSKEIIFETDDLVFDSKYFKDMGYLEKANVLEKKFYTKGVGEEILNDPYVKACTTTTPFLAEKLREKGKKVFVVPNKLSVKDAKIAEEILKNKKKREDNSVKLGYFSGNMSHNRDFASITEALMQIMEKYPHVELFLVGPLDLENKLNKFKARIKQLPYVPREKHFKNISGVDINLAPLEIGNPFCEAKSELKFFEAGILEIPTVASSTRTFRKALTDGVDGFVANTTQEWTEKLEKLITDSGLRKEMGKKAREKTLEKYTTQNSHNEEYYGYLRNLI